ncbi:hypothetical protein BJ170DRAFT_593325 [Xylariales sp. AK1849]|nr:hypothetical protein BJ170DRAFT_593325 [Xylariales sp. AK1849]
MSQQEMISRQASDRLTNFDINGNQDIAAMMMPDGPPDYTTIDPQDLDRPTTPFPRPMSLTPLNSGGQDAQRAQWPLPPSVEDEVRPDSSLSYTSSRNTNAKRVKSHSRKSKLRSPYTANRPEPIAERRIRKRSASTSSSGGKCIMTLQVPKIKIVRPASRHGQNGLDSMSNLSTINSEQSVSGTQTKKRRFISQLSRDWTTTLGSFVSLTSSSPDHDINISEPYNFQHQAGFSSPAVAGPTPQSATENRHSRTQSGHTGCDFSRHGSATARQSMTQSILMDMRTESRVGNRTSLPVDMPNVISPIDNAVFDANCGQNSSVRASVNRFQSPASPSPPATVRHFQPAAIPPRPATMLCGEPEDVPFKMSMDRALFWLAGIMTQMLLLSFVASVVVNGYVNKRDRNVSDGLVLWMSSSVACLVVAFGTLSIFWARRFTRRIICDSRRYASTEAIFELRFSLVSREDVLFWSMAALIECCVISTAAAIAYMACANLGDSQVDNGIIVWLSFSLLALLPLFLAFNFLYSRRLTTRVIRDHRQHQRDEEWIELRSRGNTVTGLPAVPEQARLAHQIIQSASQDAHHKAWEDFASDHTRLRSYAERPDHRISQNIAAADETQKRLSVDGSLPHGATEMAISEIQATASHRTSLIGIARSESLIVSQKYEAAPSMSSSTSADTIKSADTEAAIMPKSAADAHRSLATTFNEKSDTVLSAEEMSSISIPAIPKMAYIPHSAAMADLSSEANNLAISESNSKSTISSLISSYATTEPEIRTYSPHGRRSEALHSHPVAAATMMRPIIITEAGTPNSEKSVDRYAPFVESSGSVSDKTEWDIRDGLASRLATMTPIEERSEAASVYCGR